MKNIRNKKGFTLVEVIATVVILGILLTTAVMGYSKYIESSKKKYYTTQEKLVTQAGRDFFNDNRGFLPTMVGEENCVTLKTLISNKYIEDVKDYNKNNCDKEKTKVCAQKISLTKYEYDTVLICDKDENSTAIYSTPTIAFKLKNGDSFGEEETLNGTSNTSYQIVLNAQDEYGIESYQYKIYKNNKVYKTKNNVVTKSDKNINVTISLPEESGTFYVRAKVYNSKGKTKNESSGKIKQTFSKSSCSNLISFKNGTTKWTNENISVKIEASSDVKYYYLNVIDADTDNKIGDSILVGTDGQNRVGEDITNYTYTINAGNNETKRVYFKVVPYDNNNNNYSLCSIKSSIYKIDKNQPVVELTEQEDVVKKVKLKCTDNKEIVSYYYGTSANPTNNDFITNTSDLKSIQKNGLIKEVTQSGKYYLICKDNAGNTGSKDLNIVMESPYIVNHYVHDLGANTYTLNSTDNLIGTTNATVTLANLKKTISGFTYVDGYLTGNTTKPTSGAVTTTTILADGTRVINLYYRRNYLYVQYHVNGGSISSSNSTFGTSNNLAMVKSNSSTKFFRGVYGSKVGAVTTSTYAVNTDGLHDYNGGLAITRTGYTAKSGEEWNSKSDGTGTSYNQNTSTYDANGFLGADLSTGDKTVTVYVNWVYSTNTAYKVNHYTHNLDANTYTLNSTDNLTGTTNATLTLANLKKTISGFTYVDGYLTGNTTKPTSGAVTTTTILADGTRVINLYYRRNYLYVQYNLNGGSISSSNSSYGSSNGFATIKSNSSTKFFRGVYGSKVGYVDSSTYSVNTDGLHDYNGGLAITKTGYTGKSGEEWNSKSDGTGTSYNQNTSTYDANGFAGANLSTGDKTVTVYVNWKANGYTITLNKNNATNTPTGSVTATYNSSALSPSSITLPQKKYTISGFTTNADSVYDSTRHSNGSEVSSKTAVESSATFNGWYTSGGTKVISGANTPALQTSIGDYTDSSGKWIRTSNSTLYAQFGSQPQVTLPTITKYGYTCGWTDSSTGTTIKYASGEKITPSANKTLYGVCVEKDYQLTIYLNGGTAFSGKTGKYVYPSRLKYSDINFLKIMANNKPTKSNDLFYRWQYYDNDLVTNDPTFSSSTLKDLDISPYNIMASATTSYSNGDKTATRGTSNANKITTIISSSATDLGNNRLTVSNPAAGTVQLGAKPGFGGYTQVKFPTAGHRYIHVIAASCGNDTKGNETYLHSGLNQAGTGGSPYAKWITPNECRPGEGYKLYMFEIKFGNTFDYSKATSFGSVYFSPYANNSNGNQDTNNAHFSAVIAYSAIIDITNEAYGIGQLDGTAEIKAMWSPTYTLTYDKQGGSNGDNALYEKYGVGFYRDSTLATPANSSTKTISNPSKSGYNFLGYYTSNGVQIIKNNGYLASSIGTKYFNASTTLYAHWQKQTTNTATSYSCNFTYKTCMIYVSYGGNYFGWDNYSSGSCTDVYTNGVFYCTGGTILAKSVSAFDGYCDKMGVGWTYIPGSGGTSGNCKCTNPSYSFSTGYMGPYSSSQSSCPSGLNLGTSCTASCSKN